MSEVFILVKDTPNLTVIKINPNLNNLDIALNPYLKKYMDYISVSKNRGKYTLTVINTDGSTWSFDWGAGGYTLISESTIMLKQAVVNFIRDKTGVYLR